MGDQIPVNERRVSEKRCGMTNPSQQDSDNVVAERSKTLIVRHLPSELSCGEKERLLKYFGAVSVKVSSDKGRLKHTAFATFSNENVAAKVLSRLHQLKILGHTLVVEFAKEPECVQLPDPPAFSGKSSSSDAKEQDDAETAVKKEPSVPLIENGIAPSHGLTFPVNPILKYLYPPPTSSILTNIANAMASVPKFYVQVLHLMNKMNLPAPFGPITARPPMHEEFVPMPPPPIPPYPPEEPPLPVEEMEVSSEEESEYESGDEEEKERLTRVMELATLPPKRLLKRKRTVRKRPKLKDLLNISKPASQSVHPALSPSDVFEQPQLYGSKKIEFHISSDVPVLLETGLYADNREEENTENFQCAGFGKIYPVPVSDEKMEDEEDEEILSEFISRRELEKGRLSKQEMDTLSVFKNYEPGDPTCRIYVKNLTKQIQEKDLKFIFGRYIDFSSETERNMFDIRLMKEGRMKGQAFVGLPNEKAAAKAVKEVNGYVLFEKPMVVQFARSARPKQDSLDTRKNKYKPEQSGVRVIRHDKCIL
ncbi:RNA-binding region-containing protein 3 isoform X2 [Latimeria chalumnae]|uniref:RNA-binding region-containing protein 3 isoform X2 n=1 Tax=Latimeria chalumnae TaxID=7897 RepID=UPI0003C1876A|nr:PREDICTED: RNA-binding protein 40 isoform X2 [Latimeria chalumnae]|eukprot:XP_006007971.1 PREDICTED: RNA-binding protein 40 isoform X2 [Latimeria chalumnae]